MLSNPSNMNYLNVQGNSGYNSIEFLFKIPDTSVELAADFSHNNLISFAGSFNTSILYSGLCVVSLSLNDNKLGNELSVKGENSFEYFKDSLSLDLSSNGIKSLPDSVFKSQNNLRILNLSKNSLLLINFQVAHLTKITTINVSENLVSQLGEKLQKRFGDFETYVSKFSQEHSQEHWIGFHWIGFSQEHWIGFPSMFIVKFGEP